MEAMWIFIVLNGLIHTCMYGYYACMIWGGAVRARVERCKQGLTTLQVRKKSVRRVCVCVCVCACRDVLQVSSVEQAIVFE